MFNFKLKQEQEWLIENKTGAYIVTVIGFRENDYNELEYIGVCNKTGMFVFFTDEEVVF